jgi:hypothetical protein
MRDDDQVLGSEQAQQQGQEFMPAGAMGRGQQQAVSWNVCTSRAYHQPEPNRNFGSMDQIHSTARSACKPGADVSMIFAMGKYMKTRDVERR